jgi:hypothetical protein
MNNNPGCLKKGLPYKAPYKVAKGRQLGISGTVI